MAEPITTVTPVATSAADSAAPTPARGRGRHRAVTAASVKTRTRREPRRLVLTVTDLVIIAFFWAASGVLAGVVGLAVSR